MTELRDIALNEYFELQFANGDFALSDGIKLITNNNKPIFIPDCDKTAIKLMLYAAVGEIKHAPQIGASILAEIEGDDSIVQRTRIRNTSIFTIENSGHLKVDSFNYKGNGEYDIEFKRVKNG